MNRSHRFVVQLGFVAMSAIAGAAQGAIIESFDDGDVSDYTVVAPAITYAASTAAAHDGPYGLRLGPDAGPGWIYRNDAAVQVAQGDRISAWVRFEDVADSRAYFGFGSSAVGTLSFVLAPNTGDIRFQENPGFGFTELDTSPQSFLADKWYRAEVDWGVGGNLTGRLFDSDGVTLLNSVTATSSLYTSGGIAFRGFGGLKDFDTIERSTIPEPGTLALLGLGLAGLAAARRRKH